MLEYNLGNLKNVYEETLNVISPSNKNSNYKCARYKPLTYIKEKYINEVLEAGGYFDENKRGKLPSEQQNIHDFIKRMMVRRFESSIPSFLLTLQTIINSNLKIIDYYQKKKVVPIFPRHQLPNYEDLFDNVDSSDDDINLEDLDNENLTKFKSKGGWFVKKEYLRNDYIKDIENDLEILKSVYQKWKSLFNKNFNDPKIEEFKNNKTK